jgi:hypothetical protein
MASHSLPIRTTNTAIKPSIRKSHIPQTTNSNVNLFSIFYPRNIYVGPVPTSSSGDLLRPLTYEEDAATRKAAREAAREAAWAAASLAERDAAKEAAKEAAMKAARAAVGEVAKQAAKKANAKRPLSEKAAKEVAKKVARQASKQVEVAKQLSRQAPPVASGLNKDEETRMFQNHVDLHDS